MRVELEESGGDIKQTWGSVGIGHLEQRPLCGGKTNLRLILMFVHSAFAFRLTTLTSSSGYVFMFISMYWDFVVGTYLSLAKADIQYVLNIKESLNCGLGKPKVGGTGQSEGVRFKTRKVKKPVAVKQSRATSSGCLKIGKSVKSKSGNQSVGPL